MEAATICRDCGSQGSLRTKTKGSIFMEIILWCCFLLPGLIYSVWRMTSRERVCNICGSKNYVPLNSPAGQKLRRDFAPVATTKA